MTKSLREEAMLHSRLRSEFRKTKREESKQLYNKQGILSATIFLKRKRNSFEELDNIIGNDNRKFWKTENPLFLEKAYQKDSIATTRKDTIETITKQKELDETFNSFVSSIADNFRKEYGIDRQANVSTHPDSVLRVLETFRNHLS